MQPHGRLCVALSGGCDSVVLLHSLRALIDASSSTLAHIELSALHVHHGLSPQADAWADFCLALCAQWQIPLQLARVDVVRRAGLGLEAAARQARYAAFAASGADWLALAHHRDDQAETVLLNLLRGAGLAGASAMPAERVLETRTHSKKTGADWAESLTETSAARLAQAEPQVASKQALRLLRPFLGLARSTLVAYARQHALSWVEDESNANTHFRRNFLRHEVMPKLAAQFPGGVASLARAAEHFAEADGLLAELAEQDRRLIAPHGRIELIRLHALSAARARNVLRHELANAGCRMPDQRWLDEALRQLANSRAEAAICLALGEYRVRSYRGELYLFVAQPLAQQTEYWQGESCLPWAGGWLRFTQTTQADCPPGTTLLRLPEQANSVARAHASDTKTAESGAMPQVTQVRAQLRIALRCGGEQLQLDPRRPRRSLKNLCQEAGIPPWLRERLPILWCGERIAWVGLLGADCHFACAPDERGVALEWTDQSRNDPWRNELSTNSASRN